MTKERKRGIAAGAGGAGLFGGLAFAGRKVYRGARLMGMKRRTAARVGMAAGTGRASRFGKSILRSPGKLKRAYQGWRQFGTGRVKSLYRGLKSMR